MKNSKQIYSDYLDRIFEKSIQQKLADENSLTKQAINNLLKRQSEIVNKETEDFRRYFLLKNKYSKLKPKTEKELEVVIKSMSIENFCYKDIAITLGLSKKTITKILSKINKDYQEPLTKKILKA